MTEFVTQINTMYDGRVRIGDYPDEAIQAAINNKNIKRDIAKESFQAVVDTSNRNEFYADTLDLVTKYFADQGMQISPLRVVDGPTLQRAYEVSGTPTGDTEEQELGISVNNRAVIFENKDIIDVFGDDYILGIALHEAAHSTGGDEQLIRTIEEQEHLRVALGGVAVSESDLLKADLRNDSREKTRGNFWEEAFADLTRVHALRVMGRTQDIDAPTTNPFDIGNGVRMIGVPNNTEITNADSEIKMLPAEFALLAKPETDNTNRIGVAPPNFAAYALHLLDERAPGLYDDLRNARQNPALQANAIKKIESVQKGLYPKLRDLVYSGEDFAQGLTLVMKALEQ